MKFKKREILFRGLGVGTQKWFYGLYMQTLGSSPCIVTPYCKGNNSYEYVKPETVTQYTGIKDLKGNKIFEGDILKYNGKNCRACNTLIYNNHSPYPVFWHAKEAVFKAENPDNWMDTCTWHKMSIIGNIFENSELLEK